VTLRITREPEGKPRAVLRLEGSLAGEWASLLERECRDLSRSAAAVRLDLAGVGFVDRGGIEALRRLNRAGTEICCEPGPVASVLEGEGIRITPPRDAAPLADER
jgi:hypothetical protein